MPHLLFGGLQAGYPYVGRDTYSLLQGGILDRKELSRDLLGTKELLSCRGRSLVLSFQPKIIYVLFFAPWRDCDYHFTPIQKTLNLPDEL